MFSLHETARIWLCRAAFFALCLGPTCAVAAWCLAVHLPGYRRAHERDIGECLGCHARLEEASSPRPGLTLYKGLELTDSQTGQLLARVPFVEIDSIGDTVTIKLPFPATINGLRLDAVLRLAERLMYAADDARPVEFTAQNVTLHLADGDQTLIDLAGDLRPSASESRLVMKFRRATADTAATASTTPAPAELHVVRRHASPEHTEFQFTSGGTPLPWKLIASSWPAADRLGKASTFDGRVTASEQSGRWKLELSGHVGQIDLERLLAPFPHKLTGPAEVELKQVVIQDGRVENAAGKLVAGPGTVSRSLIHAAGDNLQLAASRSAVVGRDNRLAYRQLNLAFEIDESGLSLRGAFPQAQGAVLVDDKQVLVRQPTAARQPVVNLLRTLVPQTAVQVPATRETNGLAALLPVPPIVTPPGSEQPLPQAKALRVAPPR